MKVDVAKSGLQITSISLFVFSLASGQPVNFPYQHFKHLTTEQGLSNNIVDNVIQDKNGFLWFLTFTGLDRYDGYTFKSYQYSPEHSDYIAPGWYINMIQDNSGIIWISDNNSGIYSFDPVKEKFTHYVHDPKNKNSLSSDITLGVTAGTHGLIWIATATGLDALNAHSKSFRHYTHIPGDSTTIGSSFVTSVCTDEENNLWIATTSPGIDYFNATTGKVMRHFPYGNLSILVSDANAGQAQVNRGQHGNIWISSFDNGLFCYNTRTKETKHLIYPEKNVVAHYFDGILKTYEDSSGNLWIPSSIAKTGIIFYQYSSGKFCRLDKFPGMIALIGSVSCFFEDRSHTIWITSAEGIFAVKNDHKAFNSYFHSAANPTSLADNMVFCFLRDSRGDLYIGNTGVDIAKNNFSSFSHLQLFEKGKNVLDPEDNLIWQIYEDHKQDLWFATMNGLAWYDPLTRKHKWFTYDDNNVSAQSVTGITEDHNGKYWFTSWGGGFGRFDPATGKFKTYTKDSTKNIVSSNALGNLFQDSHGLIYTGSWNGGLIIFNSGTEQFKVFKHDDKNSSSISSNVVFDIAEDKNGIIWICTLGGGLNAFNPATGKFRVFTINDGLPGNALANIIADKDGHYWIGTDHGISRFIPPENPFDSTSKFSFHNYDVGDGLASNETNGFGSYCDQDGCILIGTFNNGFIRFNPDELKDNDLIPPTYITDFKLFNKSVIPGDSSQFLKTAIDVTKEITLSYKQNVISFTFASLNFIHPEKNKYAYKLDDFDKDWIYTDATKRFANYTNLDAGKYTFKVKGSNNDGVWNETPTTIHLIITPPWWQTWWFRVALFLSVALFLFALYRFRLNQILRLQTIRNRIAGDLHDDIGSTLNSISIYSEVAKKKDEQYDEALNMIGDASRKVIDTMSDIVWTINPDNDSFAKIIFRMKSLAYNLMRAKKIEYTFRSDDRLNDKKLSMSERRNFYLIFKEGINNMVKYSNASRSAITLSGDEKNIKLTIYDNGVGFNTEQMMEGNGLKNMKGRAKEMNAQLKIESQQGNGTHIELKLKT